MYTIWYAIRQPDRCGGGGVGAGALDGRRGALAWGPSRTSRRGRGRTLPKQSSKVDSVYAQLRAEIESGDLAPGSNLSEASLVTRLGISRTPIREALARLVSDGLVARDGDRGSARVSTLSVTDVHHLFGLRMILEAAAMRELAAAVADGTVDPSTILKLRDELAQLAAQPASARRSVDFYDLAERFDRQVIALTPNPLLGKAIADVRPHTLRLRSVAHNRPAREAASMSEHADMIAAIVGGDPAAAEAACTTHLRRTMAAIFDGIAEARSSSLLL